MKSPVKSPVKSPTTKAPTSSCKDGSGKFKWNGKKRNCKWMSKRKNSVIKRACKNKAKICKKTCGTCNGGDTNAPTPAPAGNDEFTIYTGKGYCNSNVEETISGKLTSAETCWTQCKAKFGYDYAELTDKKCYCQKTCKCMEENDGTKAIFPKSVSVPKSC